MLVAGPHFRLLTLGVPMLVSAAGEVVRYRTRKHFALLIRLALEPGRKFVRDYLIDLLWADAPQEHGRHSLSQAITVMRNTVGREFVAAHRNTLALSQGVIDVDALRLGSCDAEIRGRFLEGFDLRGARGFDEWREGWSARLHPKIRDCLVQHMDAARRLGDFATVERHALVLEDLDPHAEDAVRGIMEARAWVGDRSNALKAFNRFATRIAEDLDAKPSPELERVAGLLREGRRAAPRPTPDGVPPREERRFEPEAIIGREREFSVLYDAWLEVRQRKPRVMVILGDPGIGKTTLTNSFVSSCQMDGAVIARAQAYDAERELPYAVLAELVRQMTLQRAIGGAEPEALAELSRLTPDILVVFPGVPSAAEWPPEVVPLRIADSFLKATAAAADYNPIVLVVEDVHAADSASVAILHMLARKLTGLRILMILTGRSGGLGFRETDRALITDHAIENLSILELGGLPNSAARQLVLRRIEKGEIDRNHVPVDRIVHLSGGNPLALELLSNDWKDRLGSSIVDQLSHFDGVPASEMILPKAIRAWVERQTELLDERARAVLDLAAVLGRRIGDLDLYQVIGCSEGEALYQLTQLLAEGLLREVAGAMEFRNELVRAHAYYEIPSVSRLELHKRIGKVLEDRWSDDRNHDLEIAWHYIIGRHPKGIAFGVSGAEQSLRKGAPREAEQILRQIIADAPDTKAPNRVQLLLSASLLGQSKADEALPILESLLATPPSAKEELAQSARLYANAMYLRNRDSTGKHREMAERALRIARECTDKELLARALFEWARAGVASGNVELTLEARNELRRSIMTTDNPPAFAYYTDSYCNYFLLDVADAATSANTSIRMFSDAGKIAELGLAFSALGTCKLALCQFDEALKAYEAGLELSRRIGDDCRASMICSNLSATYLLCGVFDKAISLGEESLQVGQRAPVQPVLMKALLNLACAYQLTGSNAKFGQCLESLQDWIKQDRDWVSKVEYCWERAELELSLGNNDEALKLIATADREFQGRGYLSVTQGILERLRVFSTYYAKGPTIANRLAQESVSRFEGRHVIGYLETLAALAWSERKLYGAVTKETNQRLEIFDKVGARGKRASLTMQGFL